MCRWLFWAQQVSDRAAPSPWCLVCSPLAAIKQTRLWFSANKTIGNVGNDETFWTLSSWYQHFILFIFTIFPTPFPLQPVLPLVHFSKHFHRKKSESYSDTVMGRVALGGLIRSQLVIRKFLGSRGMSEQLSFIKYQIRHDCFYFIPQRRKTNGKDEKVVLLYLSYLDLTCSVLFLKALCWIITSVLQPSDYTEFLSTGVQWCFNIIIYRGIKTSPKHGLTREKANRKHLSSVWPWGYFYQPRSSRPPLNCFGSVRRLLVSVSQVFLALQRLELVQEKRPPIPFW